MATQLTEYRATPGAFDTPPSCKYGPDLRYVTRTLPVEFVDKSGARLRAQAAAKTARHAVRARAARHVSPSCSCVVDDGQRRPSCGARAGPSMKSPESEVGAAVARRRDGDPSEPPQGARASTSKSALDSRKRIARRSR